MPLTKSQIQLGKYAANLKTIFHSTAGTLPDKNVAKMLKYVPPPKYYSPVTPKMAKINKSTKEKTGMKNGNDTINGGLDLNTNPIFKFIFPPLGLLGNQEGSNLEGETVTDTGNLGQFIFPPLGFMGGSGSQAIDTGKQAIDSFNWKKMLLLGGLVLGGLYLIKRR